MQHDQMDDRRTYHTARETSIVLQFVFLPIEFKKHLKIDRELYDLKLK